MSYFACLVGWVPVVHQAIHWTTPVFLGGYLASGSWHGIALQAVNLTLSVLIYLPFVRLAHKTSLTIRKRNFATLIRTIEESSLDQSSGLLERRDIIGAQARQLASALRESILGNKELALVFQPQVDTRNRVAGVEALLRWNHAVFGFVPPNIAIAIAEEAGLMHELGRWIIEQSCRQLACWQRENPRSSVLMSINVSPTQLNDPAFPDAVFEILHTQGIAHEAIELEITEGRSVSHGDTTTEVLRRLADSGIKLAIDDFGMGYSSLLYLRRFHISAIKLDGSLTREVLSNPVCSEIIGTIAQLCLSKNIKMIAEFVETEDQRFALQQLGCSIFQGYLFSKPLSGAECDAFVQRMNA